MHICKNCVLDSRFPGISFDEKGICNFCCNSKGRDEQTLLKKRYEEKFIELVKNYKGKSSYDCVVAYSGGKDSTYTLNLIKNKYNLKILAFSFNNWFQSERAFQNIRRVMMHINVDHLVITPSFETLKKIICLSASNNLYSMKALERASSICTTCISIVRFLGFKIAIEKEIPFVVLGMSPGQAPVATSVFKTNAEILRKMQDAIFQPLFKYVGDIINPLFLEEKHFRKQDSFPYSINPLAFLNYDEKEIYKYCLELGWQPPMDTDPNSTNCLMNAFANQIHQEQFGFHPYAFEIAGLVRMDVLSREEGLKRLNEPSNEQIIKKVKQKLGL